MGSRTGAPESRPDLIHAMVPARGLWRTGCRRSRGCPHGSSSALFTAYGAAPTVDPQEGRHGDRRWVCRSNRIAKHGKATGSWIDAPTVDQVFRTPRKYSATSSRMPSVNEAGA
jgi:hypothetical protein